MKDELSPGLHAWPMSAGTNGGRSPVTPSKADHQRLRSLDVIDGSSDAELRFARGALQQEIATLRAFEAGRTFHFTADLEMKRHLKSRLGRLLHCQDRVVAELEMRNRSPFVDA